MTFILLVNGLTASLTVPTVTARIEKTLKLLLGGLPPLFNPRFCSVLS